MRPMSPAPLSRWVQAGRGEQLAGASYMSLGCVSLQSHDLNAGTALSRPGTAGGYARNTSLGYSGKAGSGAPTQHIPCTHAPEGACRCL
jgi:hypothetical protein